MPCSVSKPEEDKCKSFVPTMAQTLSALNESCDQSRINEAMMKKGVQWIFNPPAASHPSLGAADSHSEKSAQFRGKATAAR